MGLNQAEWIWDNFQDMELKRLLEMEFDFRKEYIF